MGRPLPLTTVRPELAPSAVGAFPDASDGRAVEAAAGATAAETGGHAPSRR